MERNGCNKKDAQIIQTSKPHLQFHHSFCLIGTEDQKQSKSWTMKYKLTSLTSHINKPPVTNKSQVTHKQLAPELDPSNNTTPLHAALASLLNYDTTSPRLPEKHLTMNPHSPGSHTVDHIRHRKRSLPVSPGSLPVSDNSTGKADSVSVITATSFVKS